MPSEKQPLSVLYRRFVSGLGDSVMTDLEAAPGARKPLDLECRAPLPRRLRLYVFNCTDHPSERKAGDYRIQLRLPGQRKRERGYFALEAGTMVLLAGYVADFDVFVLWDPNAHQGFAYSKGCQVAAHTVHQAAFRGRCEQSRGVRSSGYAEYVLATRTDWLLSGVRRREDLTRMSLLGEQPAPPGRGEA